jgi:N-carbamoylputrescine amidase
VELTVAVCQYATVLGDKERNVALSLEWLERAGERGAGLVVLPELITTGYALPGEAMLDLAETVPGPTTERWAEMARKHGYTIVAGLCRRDAEVPSLIYNSAVVIGPSGAVKGVYSKVVLPLYLETWLDEQGKPIVWTEADVFRPGDSLPVFDTAIGRLGIQICQDAVYPEFTRVQVLKGAELIIQLFNGIAIPTEHEPDITPVLTRARAYDNSVFVVMANKCGSERTQHDGRETAYTFGGTSHVASPQGNLVATAAADEDELLLATINLDDVRKTQWRMKYLRDWRPELLQVLCRGETGFP